MKDWDPAAYDAFAAARERPIDDLIHALGAYEPRSILDLGCGSGLSTARLCERWPEARMIGVDRSSKMLAQARIRIPGARFVEGDIATFAPPEAPDLLFANASLHWLEGHETLFPRLLDWLPRGGALALQMPDNLAEPSHRLMAEVAAEEPFAARLARVPGRRGPLLETGVYYDSLAPHARHLDIFTVHYQHRLPDAGAIADFFAPTGLKPYLDVLTPELQQSFLGRYEARLREAYPQRADGSVLLKIPRLFIIATRP